MTTVGTDGTTLGYGTVALVTVTDGRVLGALIVGVMATDGTILGFMVVLVTDGMLAGLSTMVGATIIGVITTITVTLILEITDTPIQQDEEVLC